MSSKQTRTDQSGRNNRIVPDCPGRAQLQKLVLSVFPHYIKLKVVWISMIVTVGYYSFQQRFYFYFILNYSTISNSLNVKPWPVWQ